MKSISNKWRVIARETERELAESVRVANLLGDVAVGPLIVDATEGVVLQVVRHVRDGYVNADGTVPVMETKGAR